jgi:2-oxoglutarate ferredoxin oxidoreductase subunit beta
VVDHLSDLIVEAILHQGFSIVDVLQPSVVFSNTYKLYNEKTETIPKPRKTFEEAIKSVKNMKDHIPIGVFYKVNKPVFHKELYGDWNPVYDKMNRKKRLKIVKDFLHQN